MRLLFGQAVFNTVQRRNQAATKLSDEANARGMTPATWNFGGMFGVVTGQQSLTDSQDRPCLCIAYTHTNEEVVFQAEHDLYIWMEARGFFDGYIGNVFVVD